MSATRGSDSHVWQTRLSACSALILYCFLITGCNKRHGEPFETGSGLLRRAIGAEPTTLDPANAADTFSYEVLRDLYEGLTAESSDGEVVPGAANAWSVDKTGTLYTFHLRPDARWSNGTPVRAQDFVLAWQRLLAPSRGSPVADDLRIILNATKIIEGRMPVEALGVIAASDEELRVQLEQSAPYFLQLLTHPAAFPIFSDASAHSHSSSTWVSNGAYVLSGWSPGNSLTIKRNETYWNRANTHIATVEYEFIPDESAQIARYRAGQLDMTDTIPVSALPEVRKHNASEIRIAPFLATAYYGFNLSTSPIASSIKLRQAISMAIDRHKLVNALAFGQKAAFGFVPPETLNYTPQRWAWETLSDNERVKEARRLYAEAGYSQQNPVHLTLLYNSNPGIRDTAVIIASMWKETLGINTTINEEEYRVFLESRHDRSRWDIVRLGWTADYNDASNFLNQFRHDSANNDSGYSNIFYDELLNQAESATNLLRRRAMLEASEKKLLLDYPITPLYFFVSKRLVKPYVRGFKSNPLNHVPSRTLTLLQE